MKFGPLMLAIRKISFCGSQLYSLLQKPCDNCTSEALRNLSSLWQMGSCGFIYVQFIGREICNAFRRQESSSYSQHSQPRSQQRSGAGAMFELGESQSGVPAFSNQFSKLSRCFSCFLQDWKILNRQKRIRDGKRMEKIYGIIYGLIMYINNVCSVGLN